MITSLTYVGCLIGWLAGTYLGAYAAESRKLNLAWEEELRQYEDEKIRMQIRDLVRRNQK